MVCNVKGGRRIYCENAGPDSQTWSHGHIEAFQSQTGWILVDATEAPQGEDQYGGKIVREELVSDLPAFDDLGSLAAICAICRGWIRYVVLQ